MNQRHDQHEHHVDDHPSGQTRHSFLYNLSLGGVIALAACGGSPTATSAPRASTAPSAAASAVGSVAPGLATSPATGAGTPASGTAASGTPAAGTPVARGATPVPSCGLTPDETEGPYHFNAAQVRRNITEGKPGTPLVLTFTVVDVNKSCQPIRDVLVDVWHCDASGNYSGYSGMPGGPAEGTPGARPAGTPPGGFPGGFPGGTPGIFPGLPGGTPLAGGFPAGRTPRPMSPRPRSSCAASRRPTATARRPSRRSSPAGTRVG